MGVEAGQVAVVTGGGSGIGLALGRAFSRRGLKVVLADVRPEALDAAGRELKAHGADVLTRRTDVVDPLDVDGLATATMEAFGRVDIVCNNAGVVGSMAPMWEQPLEVWRWVIDVSLFGVIHGIRSFVPHLVRQGRGHVVNTSSAGGLVPLPMLGPYNAAKHAIVGLSETLRAEFAAAGADVGVTVICPSLVATSIIDSSIENRPAGADVTTWKRSAGAKGAPPENVLSPDVVAAKALAAIERNQLHLLTHPHSYESVRARLQSVEADMIE